MWPSLLCGCLRSKPTSSALQRKCPYTQRYLLQPQLCVRAYLMRWFPVQALYLPLNFQTKYLQQPLYVEKRKYYLCTPENLFTSCSSILLYCFSYQYTVICNLSHTCVIYFTVFFFFSTCKLWVLSDHLLDIDCSLKDDVLNVKTWYNVIIFSWVNQSFMAWILKTIFLVQVVKQF